MPLPARLAVLIAAALALLAGCGAQPPEPSPPDAVRELRAGRRFAAALIRKTRGIEDPDSVTPEAALAVVYLERLRLGLGSPFRMAEQAAVDPRLSDTLRTRLAWALLARALDERAYEVAPETLDPLGNGPWSPPRRDGAWHLEQIAQAVERAGDPRAAERGVRMAY
ncbi:MAG TPA: hypothetical protein VHG51_19285, partial [Longimicrobiaceae bacterium]|nr:hypothetical protein [Longimicrobiaceae bacterium]